MAASDLASVLNNPGRLCHTPTSLSSAFPHGGTALGTTREVVCLPVQHRVEIRDEGWGQEIHDVLWVGENWSIACVLRQYDADAISAIFPNTSAGTVTQQRLVVGASASNNRPGLRMRSLAKKILFSPLDPDRVPAVLFYAAIPMPSETQDLNLALNKPLEIGAVFVALRHDTLGTHQMGFLKDMTLS